MRTVYNEVWIFYIPTFFFYIFFILFTVLQFFPFADINVY